MPNSILFNDLMEQRSRKTPRILTGIVVYSNPKTHTYDVKADDGSDYPSVPLASPYVNSEAGQGYTAVAKVGARCLIAVTENMEAVILGFFVPVGIKRSVSQAETSNTAAEQAVLDQSQINSYEGRAGNRTSDLDVDDQEISGPSGNALRVRGSGTVEAVSQDGQLLTRWICVPGENTIISLADLLENILPSGKFVWKSDIKNGTGYFTFELKSALDADADIFIKAGELPEDDEDAGQKLVVTVKGDQELKITYDGNELKIKTKDLRIEAEGEVNVKSKTATVTADSRVQIKGSTIDLN